MNQSLYILIRQITGKLCNTKVKKLIGENLYITSLSTNRFTISPYTMSQLIMSQFIMKFTMKSTMNLSIMNRYIMMQNSTMIIFMHKGTIMLNMNMLT